MLILFIFIGLVSIQAQGDRRCLTPNKESAKCIPLKSCPILLNALRDPKSDAFINFSYCGSRLDDRLVCCGTSADFIKSENIYPGEHVCGFQHSDDYDYDYLKEPVPRQFPWVAMIGYQRERGDTLPFAQRYKCDGSLISKRYILTSADCLNWPHYVPISVRLGEFNVANEIDCQLDGHVYECTDKAQDYGIERIIPHPGYNKETKANNIGLIKLNKTVKYSDYIRPVCLSSSKRVKAKTGNTLIIVGWGANYTKTKTKKITPTALINNKGCSIGLEGSNLGNLDNGVMCTLPKIDEIGCNYVNAGDGLIFKHRRRWYQEGIISYIVTCQQYLPWVFTRVEHYLDWIKETVES